jgi:polysaccharide export outer membrane protein
MLLTSCVTQLRVEYVQDANKSVIAFDESEFPDYTLKSNDELYIRINSLDEEAANVFTNASQQEALSPYAASMLSYSIDKEGNLFLPVIGKVFVKGKTLSEVSILLRDSLIHVLNQPLVSVKLVNRYVSILGEVRDPGHFSYSQEKLSVFDALGLAGDITDYGNRENVLIIRNENGKNIRANMNLTGSDVLSSSYYYLRPNDIVYVKPLRNKFWGMRQFPFTVLFSTITTGLLIYNIWR